jgi:2,3-bisphosphoglycerate-independent phosphoglycerate mutase
VKDEDDTKVDAKKQKDEKIVSEANALMRQGFGKDQIANQLSSKYQMTPAEIIAVIAQIDDKASTKEDDK